MCSQQVVLRVRYCWLLLLLLSSVAAAFDFPQPQPYRGGVNVADYAFREVVEGGVWVYWDGESLTGKGGEVYDPPSWFVNGFPAEAMAGVLTRPDGDGDAVARIARRSEVEVGWQRLRFTAVDLPQETVVFEQRRQRLKTLVEAANLPQLRATAWKTFANEEELQQTLDEMNRSGGKGFVMRRLDSNYDTDDLLLILPFDVGEATVVRHRSGKGEYSGMLGSMEVEDDNGGDFVIGTGFSLAERRNPPQPGAHIAYKYKGFTDTGKPKNPVFLRVLPSPPVTIGGFLQTTHLMWIFVSLMTLLALLDAYTHRRGGARWNFKSSIVSTGLLGTFIGIWWGLYNFNTTDIAAGVPALLDGLKFSFVTSIVGIALSTLLSVTQTMLGTDK